MKSAARGDATSVEVSGISPHGIWLLLADQELFLSFRDFPWFRSAPVAGVLRVERPRPDHRYWPDLDIDLAVESIRNPERYPLVSRQRTNGRPQPARKSAKRSRTPRGARRRKE
jgi:hypothetical protein